MRWNSEVSQKSFSNFRTESPKFQIYIKAVYVRAMIGLNDCQGWLLNSAEYESICEDMLLFQKKKKELQLQLPDIEKKVHNSG